jgi:transcriptional regulator with XRE-family HTH domain
MGRVRRTLKEARLAGRGRAKVVAQQLGALVRAVRRRRHLRQRDLAERVGLSQPRLSEVERGNGHGLPLEAWFAMSHTLDLPLTVAFGRDRLEEPRDAGHLAVQELLLRLGRAAGYERTFELPTKPSDPWRSADIGLRDDRRRLLVLAEAWNTFGDIGAAVRATNRKKSEAEALATVTGGDDGPYRVAVVWVVRETVRNRELVARYPEIFAAAFPGSSRVWVLTLLRGVDPPAERGLVWCDRRARRLWAWRRT